MKQQKYDIFISYRRKTGVDDARLLQQSLKARGYNVFFDYDSLRDGKFDERIYAAIEEAPIFILLLSEGSLDTCYKEDDWVRIEIEYAVKHECKIIPVALDPAHWAFPNNLPNSISGIVRVQISELNKAALFEESIDRIVNDRFPESLKNVMRFKRVDVSDTHDWYDKLPVLGKVVAYVKTFWGLTLLIMPMWVRDYCEWRRGFNFWICVLVAVIGFAFLVGRDRLKSFFKSSVRLLLGKSVSLNIKDTLLEILRCWLCAFIVGWLIILLAMQSLILLDIVGLYEYSFPYLNPCLKLNGESLWATGIMLALCRFFILVVMRRRLYFNKDVIWKWGIICLLPIVVFLAAKENSSYFRKKLRRIAKRQDPTYFAIKAYDEKDYSGFWSLVGRADVENIEIIRRLGTAYQKGYGIEGPDYRKAIEQYNKLLNFDTTGEIEFHIGLCLHLCKEYNKAKVCLINAVKKGYCEAFVLLGSFYEYGAGGCQVDLEKAAECYEKAMKTKNLKFYKLAEQNLNRVRRTLDRTIRKTRNENAFKNYELAWSCIEYKDGSVSLTSPAVPTNTTGELIIPSVLAGRTVRSIGEQSFGKCDLLKSVIISEGVSNIDGGAFLGCKSLENVEMPFSVTNIGDYAFAMCKSLKSITIPNGVKNVSQGMFEGCSALETVLLPSSVTNIGVVAFQDCKALTSVKIPEGVVSIGFSAFASCASLASVTIPSNVRSIEGHAFSGCKSLVALRIPMGVSRIGGGAFTDCDSLKIFVVDPENPYYCMRDGFLLTRDGKMLIDYPVKNKISLIIPDGVKCIGDNALSHGKVLDSVTFPESVTEIKQWALRDCESLKTVKFLGDKPLVDSGAFFNISTNCTVIIPVHNKTWKDVGDIWHGMRVKREDSVRKENTKAAVQSYFRKDYKSFWTLRENADQEDLTIALISGDAYANGYGCETNYIKAIMAYKKARTMVNDEKKRSILDFAIAVCYDEATMCITAAKYARYAVDRGNIDAYLLIGAYKEKGLAGYKIDMVGARECYEKALQSSNSIIKRNAREGLDRISIKSRNE